MALRTARRRVHGQHRPDLLHRSRLLLRPHAVPDDPRRRGAQRLRGGRRGSSDPGLSLLDLLRHQQEVARRARGPRVPRAGERDAREDRPPLRRRRRSHDPAPAQPRDPLEPAPADPRSHPAKVVRHQGRHPPGLSLLQGLSRRSPRRQRELHAARGPARADGCREDRQLQREDHPLRRRLPPDLRQPVDRSSPSPGRS